jgi:hypothetical protein
MFGIHSNFLSQVSHKALQVDQASQMLFLSYILPLFTATSAIAAAPPRVTPLERIYPAAPGDENTPYFLGYQLQLNADGDEICTYFSHILADISPLPRHLLNIHPGVGYDCNPGQSLTTSTFISGTSTNIAGGCVPTSTTPVFVPTACISSSIILGPPGYATGDSWTW